MRDADQLFSGARNERDQRTFIKSVKLIVMLEDYVATSISDMMLKYSSSYLRGASTIASFMTLRNAGKCATLPTASATYCPDDFTQVSATKYTNFRFTRVKKQRRRQIAFRRINFSSTRRPAGPIKFRILVETFRTTLQLTVKRGMNANRTSVYSVVARWGIK